MVFSSQFLGVLLLVVPLSLQQSSLHEHSHSHDPEPPHYKYSRAANEKVAEVHDHGHSHDHHVHSHEEHGHSHEGHIHGDEDVAHHEHLYKEDVHRHDTHQHVSSVKQRADAYKPYDQNGMFAFLNDFRTRLWVYSIGSTLLISFAPFVMLSVIPVQANTAENEPMLKVLLSFGSGGLLGDAFLHLIPHSQPAQGHGHGHSHSHAQGGSGHSHGSHEMAVGGYVLAGIITFLTVEKLVRILRSKHLVHSHSHSHSHGSGSPGEAKKPSKVKKVVKDKESDVSSAEESSQSHSDDEHKKLLDSVTDSETGFKVAAYLNMAADFAHNFTDGLAIGASYLAGTTVGVVTMITVLVHEVPHEIGDFAILVQSGFSKKKAMFVQLLTALGALTGCILSLCAANPAELSDSASSSWILPFTAGGFIYIATVSVIPELLENSSPWQSIKEVVALLVGILLMYLIAIFE